MTHSSTIPTRDGTPPPTAREQKTKHLADQLRQQLDRELDGKLSHQEIQADIKADTSILREQSCETSMAPVKADKALPGLTDALAYLEGPQLAQAEKFLATSLSKEYNSLLSAPSVKLAFPNGTAQSTPKDFLEMAKTVRHKIRECGFITSEPYLDEPNREYVKQNLPVNTAALSNKTPSR